MDDFRMTAKAILLTSLTFLTGVARAQSEYIIQNYSVKDGLDFEFTGSVTQDKHGFIWIQNAISIARFDGNEFKIYRPNPRDSTKLGNHQDGLVLSDPNGNIWICNYAPLNYRQPVLWRFVDSTESFVTYKPNVKGSISKLCFDQDPQQLWIGIYGAGIASYDLVTGNTRLFAQKHSNKDIEGQLNYVVDVKDRGTFLLVSTQRGLWKFDKESQVFSRPHCSPQDTTLLYSTPAGRFLDKPIPRDTDDVWIRIQNSLVRLNSDFAVVESLAVPKGIGAVTVVQDGQGAFWFVSRGFNNPVRGVHRYSQDGSLMKATSLTTYDGSFQDAQLNDLFIDREENVWVSSWRGIYKLTKPSLRFHNTRLGTLIGPGTRDILAFNGTEHLVIMRKDAREAGAPNEVMIADLSQAGVLNFQQIKTLTPIMGTAMVASVGKGYYWVGTSRGGSGVTGLAVNPRTGIEPGRPFSLTHDPNNLNTISSLSIQGILDDGHGSLWVGTGGEGLNKVDLSKPYGTERSVMRYRHKAYDTTSLSHDVIWWQLEKEDEKSFWVKTAGGMDLFHNGIFEHPFKHSQTLGFLKLRPDSVLITAYPGFYEGGKAEGRYVFKKSPFLADKPLAGIQRDRQGRLWFCNQTSVFMLDKKENRIIEFNEEDGLVHTNNEILQASNGLLITGDTEGFTVFDPAGMVFDTARVRPQLTSLSVNNTPVDGMQIQGDANFRLSSSVVSLKELRLDYLHNHFSLVFSAMSMISSEKNRYRHILEGYDKDWIESDFKARTATYTNLPSGTYTFRVKASNHHGVWSDKERTLKVVILPPPWRTWWAYTGYSLLAATLLVAARRSIVQRERLKASLSLEKVEREKEHFELEKAKEVDRVKTSFFTNISHEFRTPLTLIKGPVETLLSQFKDDPEVTRRLKLIGRNSDLLLRLINQLLDLAKLDSGTLKVEKSDGEVYSFIKGIAGSFESLARQKGVGLKIDVPEGTCPARFDKDKVETILINLINNAIKFTPQGGEIRVMAECGASPPTPLQRRGESGAASHSLSSGEGWGEAATRQTLTLCISDTGIGIPPEHQSKIFERFHQVSEAHKEVGTGIGLALVKELVTLMGGEISVKSEPGKGSEFTVTIPLEQAEGELKMDGMAQHLMPKAQSPTVGISNIEYPISNNEVDAGKPQVLVVEDNADLRAFIIDSLGNEFQFHQAENGKQGLQIATEHIPDMIISDVMMPEMDGMEMTRRIKEDIKTSHIPLILLTARSGEDSKLEGLSKGADDYLTKPFNKQELLLKVRNGTARMQKLREKLKTDVLSSAPTEKVLSQDEQFLNKVKETIIERMSDEQLSVESLADDIGMSRVQLYRKVSALTGMSVNELIRKLRLQRAAQLLGQQWGPVSQVAYEVGFSNLSYFSKVFKEEFDVLPSEYEIE